MFEIVVFNSVHTCFLELRHNDNRQAAPWVVGHIIKHRYVVDATKYVAKSIQGDIKRNYGIKMSYQKSWHCREKAISYVRGTPEDSYSKILAYLHMLQLKNPGTVTDFQVMYMFIKLFNKCRMAFELCQTLSN